MMPVTVILPTANRPGMLATALQTVARQSARERIVEVIVSENGGNRASAEVCARFPDLPIHYRFQAPRLSPVQHLHHLFTGALAGDAIAFLCDDDWWGIGHLTNGLAGLATEPAAAAAFCACLMTDAELGGQGYVYLPSIHYLAESGHEFHRQVFPFGHVAASCWVNTGFHFSAMVARRDQLKTAAAILTGAHPYNADRLLFVALAAEGPIVFEPLNDVFIRHHSDNYYCYTPHAEQERARALGREEVARFARGRGVEVASVWKTLLAEKRPVSAPLVALLWNELGHAALRETGLLSLLGEHANLNLVKRLERRTWHLLRPLLPPILLAQYRAFRTRVAGTRTR